MIRIGVTQRVDVVTEYDERRDALDQAWTSLLVDQGILPVPIPNRLPRPEDAIRELELDGLVLSGGNDLEETGGPGVAPERDRLEHDLLAEATERDIPVLGECRGLQVLAVHYGGTLTKVEGHVAERHALEATEHCPPSLSIPDRVNSYHDYGILPSDLPDALAPLAVAPDGTVEAVRHRDHSQVGIMWHMEREDPWKQPDVELLDRLTEGKAPW